MAGRAVDGNTSQNLDVGSCAHPSSFDGNLPAALRGSRAWWSVDLSDGDPSRTYVITSVTIYFRRANIRKIVCMYILYVTRTFKMQ